MTNYKRVAIYFLPKKNSSLENFGKNLLGRDINKKKKISLTRRQKYFINRGFTFFDELKDYCEQPAKYGFHATLKAPFRLKRNVKTKNFYDVISHIAAQHSRFKIQGLKIVYSKKFTFITSRKPNKLLINLENDLVKHLDTFRAELNKTEIKKAIESKFDVKVLKVSTIRQLGKVKQMTVRSGGRTIRTSGKKSDYKKAIINDPVNVNAHHYIALSYLGIGKKNLEQNI